MQNINTLVHAVTAHFGNAHSCFRQTFVFGMNGGCFICRQYFSSTGEPLFLIGCFSSLLFGNKRMQTRFRLLVPSPHSAEHYTNIKNNQIFSSFEWRCNNRFEFSTYWRPQVSPFEITAIFFTMRSCIQWAICNVDMMSIILAYYLPLSFAIIITLISNEKNIMGSLSGKYFKN